MRLSPRKAQSASFFKGNSGENVSKGLDWLWFPLCFPLFFNCLATVCQRQKIFLRKKKDTPPHVTSHWALSGVLNGIPQLRPHVTSSVCVCVYSSTSNKTHHLLPNDSYDSERNRLVISCRCGAATATLHGPRATRQWGKKGKKDNTFERENSPIVTPVNSSEGIKSHVAPTLFSLGNHTEANKCKPCGKG